MDVSKKKQQTVAAFDFDGTITYSDSLIQFIFFTHGYLLTFCKLILLSPLLLGFTVGLTTRQGVKEKILKSFYGGKKIEEIKKLAVRFSKKKMDFLIRPEALQKLSWHRSQGHHCVIVSASPDIYLKPWAERVGVHDVIASRLEVDSEGKVTGKLQGLNCWGPEKVRRLEEDCGSCQGYTLYAYGDSLGDKELLEKADFSFYRTME